MKRLLWVWAVLLGVGIGCPRPLHAQEYEVATLILNLEKLNQFREVLQKMYDGYKILTDGYNKVKQVTSGNFRLHDVFLDGLLLVNPEVRKYRRVAEIIEYQVRIVKEYKSAYSTFKKSNAFTADDLNYFLTVYERIFESSLQNLDELLLIITARQLRMSDEQRIAAIDRVYQDIDKKYHFLRQFNNQQTTLAVARIKHLTEINTLRNLHGIK